MVKFIYLPGFINLLLVFLSALLLFVCLSVFLSACLRVCLWVCLSACTYVCLSICLSNCLSVRLPACLTLHFKTNVNFIFFNFLFKGKPKLKSGGNTCIPHHDIIQVPFLNFEVPFLYMLLATGSYTKSDIFYAGIIKKATLNMYQFLQKCIT